MWTSIRAALNSRPGAQRLDQEEAGQGAVLGEEAQHRGDGHVDLGQRVVDAGHGASVRSSSRRAVWCSSAWKIAPLLGKWK